MTISDHDEVFAGKKIKDWEPGAELHDTTAAVRLALDWDRWEKEERMPRWIRSLAILPEARELEALVIGAWDFESSEDSSAIVEALVEAKGAFPRLTSLFLGDITFEEQEISWIQQSDVSPLLAAFPGLKELRLRGGNGLKLSRPDHAGLRKLVIESGGLPVEVVRSVVGAKLPSLEHLELWLGTENYGGDATPADLAPILAGDRFPALRVLGLRDAEIADALAPEVARAPILSQLRVLDLSLGTLSDEGGAPLVESPRIAALEQLDLHHHYLSPEMQARFRALKPVQVDLSEAEFGKGDEDDRYCAVSE